MINDAANKMHIDIIGLIETNLNWNKSNLKQRLKMAFSPRAHHQQSSLVSTEPSTYQPGGTAMIVHEPLSARTTSNIDPT